LAEDAGSNLQSLGWDELVATKRRLSAELKELTDKIIDIDRNRFHAVTNSIKEQRGALDAHTERLKQVRMEVDARNAELLAVSDKISQSKNFLSLMEARLPSEKEEDLHAAVQSNQALIDSKQYKSEREKNEILSKVKDASMKLEAIKAVRMIREQMAQLTQESANTNSAASALNDERESIRIKTAEINSQLDVLFDSKRKMGAERESLIAKYDEVAKQFEAINSRLDAMSEMRKKQREEYGYGLPSDALFKVKEMARKKLESGSKLTFEEMKLLYGEKD
jgi:chromosome segregation ATPase